MLRELKRWARLLIVPVLLLSGAGYFGWSAVQGNRGLVAQAERMELLRQVEATFATARAERDMWERRVSGLRASQLNPDTLDERARAMLHLANPTDIVVQYPEAQKLF